MLKILPNFVFKNEIKTKCGEIFYQDFNRFTIFCTFCEIKSFQFDDFLLHMRNVHSDNILETEINTNESINYLEESIEDEYVLAVKENNLFDIGYSDNINDDESCEEKEPAIFKRTVNTKVTKSKNSKNKNDINCKKQTTTFDNKEIENSTSNFRKHNKDIDYLCIECNEIFSQKKSLDQHVIELHNGYKCSLCDKRFRRSYHLSGHLKTHKSEKKFICPEENCGRGFIEEEYLKRHLEVHTMERTFVCDYENCGKAFHTQRRLSTHKYTHRMPKKLVCDMCGHSCRSNTELITHQRVHTGEKPFSCKVCSKPFISKTALTEHMISHSEIRPHICPVCKAAFANRRVLIRHSYIHSDERTFKCKMCDSAFKHPNSLQGHIRHVHRKPTKHN